MTLTIIHYLSNGAMVHDEWHRNVPYSVFCYALGDKPPRYPVPAIVNGKTRIALRWYELDMPHIFRKIYFHIQGYDV